ncbi:F420-0--gamma-glutamyl ligase [Aerococcus urinaehominis]|uniref:F420-0--gamma-glutamyl ligase n=1 Tax=Aerococcus urinaehominis TaxID=128944 RepID=A0A120IAQ3_9LACT|nr:coenzyme F420-0:L-glutamate ligase [Aerococcus urinaehominis]AMB98800.1 F420-0--gamma-glutamyl ligase [Aerococcus urinaehominis]SDM12188.1 F420-0:Gamma-glutamyl ligase [Aerococcus urinaehominis]
MSRAVGTVVRGLRAPIIKENDDLAGIVVDTVINASESEGYELRDHDIVTITESILARAQGNFAQLEAVAKDIRSKTDAETIGIVNPILSRNRFYAILKGIAMSAKKVVIQLSYPSDEVGNRLISRDELEASDINPYTDVLSEAEFRSHFSDLSHEFTGEDYVALYNKCVEEAGAECEIIFANHPQAILDYVDTVIIADIHDRKYTRRTLEKHGAKEIIGLDEILNQPVDGSGYNESYGLLGANLSGNDSLKLFPRDCQTFVEDVQKRLLDKTGKVIEVMIYGDGAFQDPVGHIWELADPVVSPGFTKGLSGTPDEIKIKYVADNQFGDLSGEELAEAMRAYIKDHDKVDEAGHNTSLGTTPRNITDLVGSLSDLTSGSGDKGTPFIYIQGYFDKYSDED